MVSVTFTSPRCSCCRYCALLISDLVPVQQGPSAHGSTGPDLPPSQPPLLLLTSQEGIHFQKPGCVEMTSSTTLLDCPKETKCPLHPLLQSRDPARCLPARLPGPSSHSAASDSIGHIPARVSGQRSRWRTRSGLRAAVICLTSD